LLLDGEATTRDVVSWGYCRKVYRGERLANHDYRSTRRVLERIAVRVGRSERGSGRPILWRLRNSGGVVIRLPGRGT
jgi:hypothetical protein